MNTTIKDVIVTIRARDIKQLRESTSLMNYIENHCGSVGGGLVDRVLENNGVTEVNLNILATAMDTQSGVSAIFDNFELSTSRFQPLVFWLLREISK